MVLSQVERDRALERYRLFFKIIGAVFALSVALTVTGALQALMASQTTTLGLGVLLFSFAGLYGYKIVLSTMRIIDEDARETGRGWPRV